ncbi:hypothetical protein UFOVP78_39 [uncultured Caudovirales phage]|uniref:Uncharacterized protein n=1 Tax=uncultured Caudovirales phage TaxID=2100421 RepID=A0A6J5L1B5_9CAUD|nr:hypothetical protein UFOVP78_39 [uncultured Caudovirales phage]
MLTLVPTTTFRRDAYAAGTARCAFAMRLQRAGDALRNQAKTMPLGRGRAAAMIRGNMLLDAGEFVFWLAGGDRDEARRALLRAREARALLGEVPDAPA